MTDLPDIPTDLDELRIYLQNLYGAQHIIRPLPPELREPPDTDGPEPS